MAAMFQPNRRWLTEAAQGREAEILASQIRRTPGDTRIEIERLVEENTRIHEQDCINLNPAANALSPRAEAALSSGLSGRPSLGHAGEKYEMGLEAIEELEVITANLACQVFEGDYAEIRPLSGAMANLMAFMTCTKPGDAIIVPPPSIAGHITHNHDGVAGLYGLDVHEAPIDADRYTVDVEGVRALAHRVRPAAITIGTSLNLLPHPVAALREIADEVGATLIFDAAHACGMFAGRQWVNPLSEGAHVMTMSTYKSLAGPAGGLIMTNETSFAERLDAIAYPGMTANFDAGRTTALALTLTDWIEYGEAYSAEMRASASVLTDELKSHGVNVFETEQGPTTSHQFALVDEDAGSTVQRLRIANLLTCEIGLPATSGIRLGTPEIVRWGMTSADMASVATFIADALEHDPKSVAPAVSEFRQRFSTISYCG